MAFHEFQSQQQLKLDKEVQSIIDKFEINQVKLIKLCNEYTDSLQTFKVNHLFGTGQEAGDVVLAYLQRPFFKICLVRVNFNNSQILHQQCNKISQELFNSEHQLAERMCAYTLKFLRLYLPHLYDTPFILPFIVQDYPVRYYSLPVKYQRLLQLTGIYNVQVKVTSESLASLNYTNYSTYFMGASKNINLIASCFIGETYCSCIRVTNSKAGLLDFRIPLTKLPKTDFDFHTIDRFDKLITSDHISETVRNCLIFLHSRRQILSKYHSLCDLPNCIKSHFKLDTDTMAHIVLDESEKLSIANLVMLQQWELETNTNDRQVIKKIVKAVIKRSATLSAIPIVVEIMNHIKHLKEQNETFQSATIGCNGSLIEIFPDYNKYFSETLANSPLGPDIAKKINVTTNMEAIEIGGACLVYQ